MSDLRRRDYICPGVDLYLVADANGGWAYSTTDHDEAHGRGEAIGGVVGRVNVVGDYRKPAQPQSEPRSEVHGHSDTNQAPNAATARPDDPGRDIADESDAAMARWALIAEAIRPIGLQSAFAALIVNRVVTVVDEIVQAARAAGRREADNAILWNTDCVRCANHLDRDYAEQAGIEQRTRAHVAAELRRLADALPDHAAGIRHAASYLETATMVASQAIPAYVERVGGDE